MMLSEAFAIGSALCIALSSMILSELKGRVPLFQLTRWQLLAAFAMTGLVSLAVGGWRTVGQPAFWLLSASGIVGIAIAGTTYFATIYIVGPRITALLFALTAPFALALGYLVLGEMIGGWQGLGVALVLGGVVLAIGKPGRISRGDDSGGAALTSRLWLGIGLGIFTAFGQAVGTLLARPAMAAGVEPFTAMALRAGVAAIVFIALSATPLIRETRAPLRFSALALALLAAFLGTGLGMALMMAALHGGDVGIVSTLTSTAPVLILPMVWIRSRRRPASAAWLGALLAIGGTALISL